MKFWTNRRIILKVPLLKRKGWSGADRWREKAQSKSKLRKNESEEHVKRKKEKDGGGVDFRRDQASQCLH